MSLHNAINNYTFTYMPTKSAYFGNNQSSIKDITNLQLFKHSYLKLSGI